MILASMVSLPDPVVVRVKDPFIFTVPAYTKSLLSTSLGIGSPVIIDSSMLELPIAMIPSRGIFSPGLTRTRSPGWIRSIGMLISAPEGPIKRASLGIAIIICDRALLACLCRRFSRNCPSSIRTTIPAEDSK